MKLFSEAVEEVEYITEEKESGDKNYKIRGVFMQADVKNRNGRVYPMEVLEKEVDRYVKEYVEPKRAFGELGYPHLHMNVYASPSNNFKNRRYK